MSGLHISAKKGHVEVIRTLINKCPDICELLDNNYRTALHVSAESRNEDPVKFLLESFAFQDLINKKDNKGNTALHLSAASAQGQGDLNILEIMLANDSDIDRWARNKDGIAFSDIILSNKQLEGIEISTTIMSELEREIASIRLEQSEGGEEKAEQKQQKDGHHQEPEVKQKDYKELASLNLVISTLIATITFGPVIQVPGGFDQNGFAVHGGKRSFLAFLILDSLAFWFSTSSILIYLVGIVTGRKPIKMIIFLTEISLIIMGYAYIEGLRAVLPSTPSTSIFWWWSIVVTTFTSLCYVFSIFSMFNR
ncbi:ankyrin repeat-containing protein ITN1-like [Ziziphus jujuba]|uniref:Ankyrin repeat-containing protein ITN1-like n=1 Tax=Ziziphus jujuba TaxID=326968 RepID=A0A6P3ZBX7_ZIZJJ|nr:ankyrin repeat-containing protein ITN1-like [Ziziphus jujuba]